MKRSFVAFISCLAAMPLLLCGCSSSKDPWADYKRVSMHASWSYNYGSVRSLTDNSNIIAMIKITDMKDTGELMPGIMSTTYTAQVRDLIYGNGEKEIDIFMTGGIDHDQKLIREIADDPLMSVNDEFLIFARKNESGTYTILGGPQGRFVVDNELVYSLEEYNAIGTAGIDTHSEIKGKNIDDFIKEIKSYIT